MKASTDMFVLFLLLGSSLTGVGVVSAVSLLAPMESKTREGLIMKYFYLYISITMLCYCLIGFVMSSKFNGQEWWQSVLTDFVPVHFFGFLVFYYVFIKHSYMLQDDADDVDITWSNSVFLIYYLIIGALSFSRVTTKG